MTSIFRFASWSKNGCCSANYHASIVGGWKMREWHKGCASQCTQPLRKLSWKTPPLHICYWCPYLQESLKMSFIVRHTDRPNNFEFYYWGRKNRYWVDNQVSSKKYNPSRTKTWIFDKHLIFWLVQIMGNLLILFCIYWSLAFEKYSAVLHYILGTMWTTSFIYFLSPLLLTLHPGH